MYIFDSIRLTMSLKDILFSLIRKKIKVWAHFIIYQITLGKENEPDNIQDLF